MKEEPTMSSNDWFKLPKGGYRLPDGGFASTSGPSKPFGKGKYRRSISVSGEARPQVAINILGDAIIDAVRAETQRELGIKPSKTTKPKSGQ